MEILATTRAMRRLKPDPVPDELLERLVEAATWGPSGSNMQSYEYIVVTDRDVMARLAVLWRRCVEQYLERAGAGTPAASDPGIVGAIRYQAEHFHETPALIVACYRHRTDRPPSERELLSAAASIFPGIQNLLLAARAHGLGAVMTTWHTLLLDEFKQELGLPPDVRPFAIIPVGWPLGRFGRVRRRPAAEVIHRDRW